MYHCAINLHLSYMAYVNRIEFVFVNTYQKFVVTNYIAEPFHRIFLGFFSNTRKAILVNEWKNMFDKNIVKLVLFSHDRFFSSVSISHILLVFST